jgi:LPXTG-motif cell wall-anchored protein
VAPQKPTKRKASRPGSAIQARPVNAPHGRVTPKGTGSPTASGRYTAPIPREARVSAAWVPWVMGILLITGMLVIITNYMNLLPGDDPSNWYLLGGLGLITAGFIVATKWK